MIKSITTPIFYVNADPHIGHVYSALMADILTRAVQNETGERAFFLTGTDEHAEKVRLAAEQAGIDPLEWCDKQALRFGEAFVDLNIVPSEFIRTTQKRHQNCVTHHLAMLKQRGEVYEGEFEGWYDTNQEEYVTEYIAKQHDYKSPVTGFPLDRKKERNWFFRLGDYQSRLISHIENNEDFITPTERRNEVLRRLENEDLHDIPITRHDPNGWGIRLPWDNEQIVYVWIDALFNYKTGIDGTDWPPVHIIAKDILWFHTVIWPCLLFALDIPLPERIHAHSFWTANGHKMGKSAGNFISTDDLEALRGIIGLDGVRYYLAKQGPWGASDASYNQDQAIAVYNTDLASGFGNFVSRVVSLMNQNGIDLSLFNTIQPSISSDFHALKYLSRHKKLVLAMDIKGILDLFTEISRYANKYLSDKEPWKIIKQYGTIKEFNLCIFNSVQMILTMAIILQPFCPFVIEQFRARDYWKDGVLSSLFPAVKKVAV